MYLIIYCHDGDPRNTIEISRDFEIVQYLVEAFFYIVNQCGGGMKDDRQLV